MALALHPDFADQDFFKPHYGLRGKPNKDLVADKRCIRTERRDFQKRKRVVGDRALLEFHLRLPFVAFTLTVGLDANEIVRQELAISLLVLVLDGFPFRLDFRIEQVREIRLSSGLGWLAGPALWLLPVNETSQHKSCARPGKIVPHCFPSPVLVSCHPGGHPARFPR